tara:strand:+ start:992 stop:1258 length:267 start_codon:yes stop_codon:yes gene_type:complete
MPLYAYNCSECKGEFSIRHSYKAKDIVCSICGSDKIQKNLSYQSVVSKVTKQKVNEKTGTEVKKAIQDGKQELSEYKKKQSNRVYKKK